MSNSKLTPSLKHALKSFQIAEAELNRPSEDMVTLCACQHMRNSVNDFLESFLAGKSIDIIEDKTFDELIQYCTRVDAQFKAIDSSCFLCNMNNTKNVTAKYCLSPKKVNECFVEARMLKNLVLAKLNISEKDLE
jgi:hypothetical protein